MFNKKIIKAFTLLELIVVIVVLGILAMLAAPTFNTVKEKSADSVANKNASAVQRDFNAQAALAQSDPSLVPSASGAWVINGTSYSYTATAGNTGQNVVASKANGVSGGGSGVKYYSGINSWGDNVGSPFQYGTPANVNVGDKLCLNIAINETVTGANMSSFGDLGWPVTDGATCVQVPPSAIGQSFHYVYLVTNENPTGKMFSVDVS